MAPASTPIQWTLKGIKWGWVLIITIFIFLGAMKLFDPHWFPIRQVSVCGQFYHLNATLVRQLVMQPLHAQGFFSVSVDTLRRALEATPWIHQATIKRVWPDTLEIYLHERQFIAQWGKTSLLSADGYIFTPEAKLLPSVSPIFWGEPSEAQSILNAYEVLSFKLTPLQLKINELFLDRRQSWRVKLSNGITIELGRGPWDKKMDRFIPFYRQYLSKQKHGIVSVDMRHTNGVAVSWNAV